MNKINKNDIQDSVVLNCADNVQGSKAAGGAKGTNNTNNIKNTKEKILLAALKLFAKDGYEGVSVSAIAGELGITKGALYKHYKSKRDIFDAVLAAAARRYADYTAELSVHMQNAGIDGGMYESITADALTEKVRQIFLYSLRDDVICQVRRMLTVEQFRSKELAELYTERYVRRIADYHAEIFAFLIKAGRIKPCDPQTLSLMYVAPIITLIGVCDRQPEKEAECLEKLSSHVALFFEMVNVG